MALTQLWSDAVQRAGGAVDRGVLRVMERAMRRSGPTTPPADAREKLIALARHYDGAASGAYFAGPPLPEVVETRLAPRAGADERVDLAFPSRYRPFATFYVD